MSFTVTRTSSDSDRVITWTGLDEREARQLVAFCAHDNLGMTKGAASKQANRADIASGVVELGPYTFRIERQETP